MFSKITLITALFLCPAASVGNHSGALAALPIHPGHPIVGISHAEAKRERALTKSFLIRLAFPAQHPSRNQIFPRR